MYTPSSYKFENDQDKIAFIQQYSFATMVTNKNGVPVATQLPFSIKAENDKLVLSSHFGKANEQTKYIEDTISLIIFSEPHAYISPSHYDKQESVPTWDYIAVHAYGKARILHEQAEKKRILEETIQFYEKEYMQQWEQLPDKYRDGLMKGIVAFELEVTDLQGQAKLSQDKSIKERQRIIETLEGSSVGTERELAAYIRKTVL